MLSLILIISILLIPEPVSFTQEEGICQAEKIVLRQGRRAFRKAVSGLEDWQQKEAYRLTLGRSKVNIEALTEVGVFRARKSLEQLQALGDIPCGVVLDYPRLRHRGLMIDESRSFKGLAFLKKQIDAMAFLKLNVLHLHLDDSAGWRIESDSYPDLTAKTAWRKGYTYHEWEAGKYKFTTKDDPEGYGGCYSKEELRDLVAYASERHITVIPEIEMPGHSMEVGYAYPEVLCVLPDGRLHTGAWDLCPGSESTFTMLMFSLKNINPTKPRIMMHAADQVA